MRPTKRFHFKCLLCTVRMGFSGQFIFGDRFLIILIKLDTLHSFIASLISSKLYRSRPITVIISGIQRSDPHHPFEQMTRLIYGESKRKTEFCRAILNLLFIILFCCAQRKGSFTRKKSVKNPKKELWFLCNFISLLVAIFAELDCPSKPRLILALNQFGHDRKMVESPAKVYNRLKTEQNSNALFIHFQKSSEQRNKNLKFHWFASTNERKKKK